MVVFVTWLIHPASKTFRSLYHEQSSPASRRKGTSMRSSTLAIACATGLASLILGGCVSVPGITSPIPTMSAEQKAMACAQLLSVLASPERYPGARNDARYALKGNQCPDGA
jgi:hypothetical protein